MSVPRRRHEKLVNAKPVGFTFEEAAHERLAAMAKAAGTSKSALAQWLVQTIEVDRRGVPVGWFEDHPKAEGELPLADTA